MERKERKAARDKVILEREVDRLKVELNDLDDEIINAKNLVENTISTYKKRHKVLIELEKKFKEKINEVGDDRGKGKINEEKRKKLEKIIEERFYEFNKIGNYLNEKEKNRIDKQEEERQDEKEERKAVMTEYSKPNTSNVCIKYMKKQEDDNNYAYKVKPSFNESVSVVEIGNKLMNKGKGKKGVEIFTNTFRVSKNTTAEILKRHACEFWDLSFKSIKIIDANKNELKPDKLIDSSEVTKSARYTIFKAQDEADFFDNLDDEKDSSEKKKDLDINDSDLKTLFRKYFYQLKDYFQLDNTEIVKKLELDDSIHDYHPIFLTLLFLLTSLTIYSVFSFYKSNESSMRNGFKHIFSKWGNQTIYDINTREKLMNYLEFIATSKFREEFMLRDDFEFIGVLAVRQVRTHKRNCSLNGAQIGLGKNCYNIKYELSSKKYEPLQYAYHGKTEWLYYGSSEENRISSTARGEFSDYDGSGYLMLLDHINDQELAIQADKLKHMRSTYLKVDTRAVIINYNLRFKPKNLNMTSSILFEFSPIGDILVHPIEIRLFVIHYLENRPFLFFLDIFLMFFSFIFMLFYAALILNLRRNDLSGYMSSKEGVLNTVYIICEFVTIGMFCLMNINAGLKKSADNDSEDDFYYFNDFSTYIKLYENYKLLKAIGLCILVARFSFIIVKSEKGNVIIKSIKKIGDKFIFIFLINLGVVTAFSIMYTYGVGIYQKELSSFFKTFLFLVIFTLRNSLFDDLDIFDNFTLMLFLSSYLILISIVGIFLQVLFSDTVRNVFLDSDMSTVDDLKIDDVKIQNKNYKRIRDHIKEYLQQVFYCFNSNKTNPQGERNATKVKKA